jgi:hypothetical protein
LKQALKLLCALLLFFGSLQAYGFNAAFFYGSPFPQELHIYDAVIVEADHSDFPQVTGDLQNKLYAYTSLGEVGTDKPYASDVPIAAKTARNSAWKSDVMDQTNPAWRAFYLDKIIAPLWQRGFRGIFIDTLDSYQLAATSPQAKASQEAGMVETIRQMHERFPEMRIILNRGFEILPQVHRWVKAVVAESLFQGWNNVTQSYIPVTESNRQWLLTQLHHIQDNYHLPVIVIDYAAPKERQQARDLALKIHHAGFIPWVSDGALDMIGVGYPEIQPRRILMLYDGRENQDVIFSDLFQFAAMPVEHMGFIPEYHDLTKALPDYQLAGQYAGIILWTNRMQNDVPQLKPWLLKQINQGLHLAVMDEFGFERSNDNLKAFGLTLKDSLSANHVEIVDKDPMVGFEYPVQTYPNMLDMITAGKGSVPILRLKLAGQTTDVAAYMPWGGYVLAPFAIDEIPYHQGTRWIINPFIFFKRALDLPDMPAPDVTTSTGRRLLMAHMDGDGFASNAEFPGSPLAARVMLEKIFKKYPIPTAVSVIEGETAPWGLYPRKSAEMEQIAREIYHLPHIEIASHSYSHPFKWQKASQDVDGEDYHLLLPGYQFNLTREIVGSVHYINQRLAPPGKSCQIFLWTGDCNPGADAIAQTDALGLLNMNGGLTLITNSQPSLSFVAPLGVTRDGHFQIYAPNENENVYTNNWTGPFYGFRRVIETFKLTDAPRRLKPVDIYFHTYSASKPASLKALDEVFSWALKQPYHPIYPSEYIRRVMDFNHSVMAREGDSWLFYGNGQIDTLRIESRWGYPVLNNSIVGYRDFNADRYLHLLKSPVNVITLTPQPPSRPYLVDANGTLIVWQQHLHQTNMTLNAYVNLDFTLNHLDTCHLYDDKGQIVPSYITIQRQHHYQTHAPGQFSFQLDC